jgi:hypothetical protein
MRVHTGTFFIPAANSCRYLERVEHLAKHLQWLSPLQMLTREDQELLGLRAANGRLLHAAEVENEADVELDELDSAGSGSAAMASSVFASPRS